MATLAAFQTGNLNAANWVSGDTGTNAVLLSTSTGTTALTTGNLDSATFTLTAAAMQYLMIRLGSRAAGSPSNTMTITLVNSTSAGNRVPAAWVINVSDLPPCTTTSDDGGYILLKANATWTPNGTDVYLIRATLSATTTAVSLCTNGTANNWQRAVCKAATATPAAADDMHIAAIFSNSTNPATRTTVAMTQDQTAATDYGSANTNYRIPALAISAGSLTSGVAAATNYILQLSGSCAVFAQGTLNLGTVATPQTRGGKTTLQFDCAADGDFGLYNRNGTCIGQGVEPTSGKLVTWTLLTADVAAAGTAMTVSDDTGWKNGSLCAIAATSRTGTEAESFTLNGDAGASSLTASAGLGAAHAGSTAEKMQAEVVLLTRNVEIKSVSTTALSFVQLLSGSTNDFDWVLFQNLGGSATVTIAVDIQTTTGSATFSYCALHNVEATGFKLTGTLNGGTVTIEHTVGYLLDTVSTSASGFIWFSSQATTTGTTINDVVAIGDSNVNGFAAIRIQATDLSKYVFTNVRVSSFAGQTVGSCVSFEGAGDNQNAIVGPFYLHSSNGNDGMMRFPAAIQRLRIDTVYGWRSGSYAIYFGSKLNDVQFIGTTVLYGNLTAGIEVDSVTQVVGLTFADLRCYGDTTFGQPRGFSFDGGQPFQCRVLSGDFGTASGRWVGHSTADLDFAVISTAGSSIDLLMVNTNLASSTPINAFTFSASLSSTCRLRLANYNRTAVHFTKTPFGDVTYETSTVDVSPSIKMTPVSTVSKLDTSGVTPDCGFFLPVDSGVAPTVSVKVQTDASYNGNAPRLILRANAGIGITADTVIATWSGSSGSFVTLSGTTASPTATGVMEFVVDCDGTAGNVYVDSWSADRGPVNSPMGNDYWYLGLPAVTYSPAIASIGSGAIR